jgi:nitrogen fixation NifU-like protein
MLRGEDAGRDLGELKALEGVRRLHARVKCATLPWVTLERALDGAPGPAVSEG